MLIFSLKQIYLQRNQCRKPKQLTLKILLEDRIMEVQVDGL